MYQPNKLGKLSMLYTFHNPLEYISLTYWANPRNIFRIERIWNQTMIESTRCHSNLNLDLDESDTCWAKAEVDAGVEPTSLIGISVAFINYTMRTNKIITYWAWKPILILSRQHSISHFFWNYVLLGVMKSVLGQYITLGNTPFQFFEHS